MKGFLLINKKKGQTSFDVIRKLRGILKMNKIGHAGTLDPLATGLLIIALGEGTKLLEYFIGMDKVYEVVGDFGSVSDTFDADGEITHLGFLEDFSKEEVERCIRENFLGEIFQVPPKFSALKINGQRACDIVRKGGDVEMKSRKVKIKSFDVLDFNWPLVKFEVSCGSGTYIRSLIHDLGQKLGCGAYVKELKRTKIGKFSVDDARDFNDPELISLEDMVNDFPRWDLSDDDLANLSNGKIYSGKTLDSNYVMGFFDGRLIGVIENEKLKGGVKFRKMIL